MAKPKLEFFPTDDIPWVPVAGAPSGHYQKILTEDSEKMFVTRMLRVDPGCASTETFVHLYSVHADSDFGIIVLFWIERGGHGAPAGELESVVVRVDFDRRLMVQFRGFRGHIRCGIVGISRTRLDDALGLSAMAFRFLRLSTDCATSNRMPLGYFARGQRRISGIHI